MSDDAPERPARAQRTRRLSLASRMRGQLRRAADRVLGADALWSAAFVAVMLSVIATQRCAQGLEQLSVRQIAPHDIPTTYDVDVVDDALTEERRQGARRKILDVYVHDSERRLQRRGTSAQGRSPWLIA